jgi:Fe-S cluster assembly iron-binding protein IscA
MISQLTAGAQLPEGGLRIADEGPTPGLHMSVAPEPADDDVVVLQHQVAVFLDPVAADRLTSETLDARSTEAGAAFFLEP